MSRALKILFFILTVLSLHAQNDNPFDLRVRRNIRIQGSKSKTTPPPPQTPKTTPSKSKEPQKVATQVQTSNPFEKGYRPKEKEETPKTAGAPSADKRNRTKARNKATPKKPSRGNDYMFWILTFVLLLLSIVINLNRSVLGIIYRAVTNDSYSNSLALSSNQKTKVILNLYYLIYLINAGIFLYLALRMWMGWSGLGWLLKCIGVVFVAYGLYYTALMLLKWIYPLRKEITLYVFNIRIFESFLGLLLLILNFAVAFTPPPIASLLIKIGIGLFIMTYLLRILRGFFLSYRYLFTNTFHFILYLCAFEIAPFLIIYLWVQNLG